MVGRKWTIEEKKRRSLLYTGKKNPFYGKRHKGKTKLIISKANLGKRLKAKPGYAALHTWIKRRLSKPKLCVKCKVKKPYDLANITKTYNRDFNNWLWLCRSCHSTFDNKVLNIKRMQTRKPIDKKMVIKLREQGLSYYRISKIVKISPQSAWNIVHGLWMDK